MVVFKILHSDGIEGGVAIASRSYEKMELRWGQDSETHPCIDRRKKRKGRKEDE